jgi:DnaJ-class molecular chaperone
MSSFYADLELEKNASLEDIKKAYRKLALRYHPDKPDGDTAKFQCIQTAYETLGDPEKKQRYDSPSISSFPAMFDMNNLFKSMNINFNQPPSRLTDLKIETKISLLDTLQSSTPTQIIKRTIPMKCESCTKPCADCKGQGYIMKPFVNGFVSCISNMECAKCQKTGYAPKSPECTLCDAEGNLNKFFNLQLPLCPTIICFNKLGAQPQSFLQVASNLHVTVVIVPDDKEHISFDHNNIIYSPELTVRDILLGCTLTLPLELSTSLYPLSVTIPPLSLNPKFKITLLNHGFIINDKGDRSNLVVTPRINYDAPMNIDLDKLKSIFI